MRMPTPGTIVRMVMSSGIFRPAIVIMQHETGTTLDLVVFLRGENDYALVKESKGQIVLSFNGVMFNDQHPAEPYTWRWNEGD